MKCASRWAGNWRAKSPADADVVMPIPDFGVPAALGFARELGIPFELGIIRNHYVGRTFIEPTQTIRSLGVKLKHNANRAVMHGKRIVLVDDLMVRGTTSVKIVRMMYEAGAREVHMRVASPPIALSRLLRHRYAGAAFASRRDPHGRGDARIHRRHLARLPVGRRHLQVGRL